MHGKNIAHAFIFVAWLKNLPLTQCLTQNRLRHQSNQHMMNTICNGFQYLHWVFESLHFQIHFSSLSSAKFWSIIGFFHLIHNCVLHLLLPNELLAKWVHRHHVEEIPKSSMLPGMSNLKFDLKLVLSCECRDVLTPHLWHAVSAVNRGNMRGIST